MRTKHRFAVIFCAACSLGAASPAPLSAASGPAVGQLVAETGSTAQVASAYGKGVADAIAYINQHGGVDGKPVALDTVDYGYDLERALSTYKSW